MLSSDDALDSGGQVIVHEFEGEVELGIQFGAELENSLSHIDREPRPHDLGVVGEEISHFVTLSQAATKETKLSRLDLEVLGEIDRFLVLLHAEPILSRAGFATPVIWTQAQISLATMCRWQFELRDFQCPPHLLSTYVKAETVALSHLRKAFHSRWHDSYVNRTVCDLNARAYLVALRNAVTECGQSVRIFLECA